MHAGVVVDGQPGCAKSMFQGECVDRSLKQNILDQLASFKLNAKVELGDWLDTILWSHIMVA